MKKVISIIMGSQSDLFSLQDTITLLKEFGVAFEVKVLSAHRTPKLLAEYIERAARKGTKIFIAAAGGAAALAGATAAHTILPVIAIPVETKSLKGLDSLLSTVQMPAGIPVATMAIGRSGAQNAALFALAILGLNDAKISKKLAQYRRQAAAKIKKIKLRL